MISFTFMLVNPSKFGPNTQQLNLNFLFIFKGECQFVVTNIVINAVDLDLFVLNPEYSFKNTNLID